MKLFLKFSRSDWCIAYLFLQRKHKYLSQQRNHVRVPTNLKYLSKKPSLAVWFSSPLRCWWNHLQHSADWNGSMLGIHILPVVFGRMLPVKEGYKRLLWLERTQEKIVDFKGGSLPRDKLRANRPACQMASGVRLLHLKFLLFLFI